MVGDGCKALEARLLHSRYYNKVTGSLSYQTIARKWKSVVHRPTSKIGGGFDLLAKNHSQLVAEASVFLLVPHLDI